MSIKFQNMDNKKTICGIIGKPLNHSLSPIMHNTIYKKMDLDFEYYKFELLYDEINECLEQLKKLDFRGLNVTMPYKSMVIQYLDQLDGLAQMIGAVNTIVNDSGILIGYNTDSYGAIESIKRSGLDLGNLDGKILILGAGGSARAVSFALSDFNSDIMIANRTYEKSKNLVLELSKRIKASAVTIEDIGENLDKVKLIINCTSVGMEGTLDGTPITTDLIRSDMIIFDIIYNPKDTKLLLEAKKKGAKIIHGYEMLVYQGARSFELWTGIEPPVDTMREVVLEELARF